MTLSQGYLERTYLDEPYMSGSAIETVGFQASITITPPVNSFPFQSLVGITNSLSVAEQALTTIDASKRIAMQGNIVPVLGVYTAFQSLINASKTKATGFQAVLTFDASKIVAFQARVTPLLINNFGMQAKLSVSNVVEMTAFSGGVTQIMHYNMSYLVEPYLMGAYLVSRVTANLPMQAKITRTQSNLVGVQARITVSPTRPVAFQSLVTLSRTKSTAFQSKILGSKSIAFQGRIVIYNTTKLRILTDFPSRGLNGLSWSCTSVASGDFSTNNLNTDLVEQVFRTAPGGVTGIELVCDTQLPQGVFVDTLAILNHNFSGSASVFFDSSNTSTFNEVETIPLALDRTNNTYYVAPVMPLISYRYWRLRITDAANPDGYIQIGTIVFGNAVIFAGDNFVDQVRFGRKQFADGVFTEGFTNVKNDRGLKKNLNLEFKNLLFDRSDYKNLRSIIETQSTLFKCLWIPTPESPSRFALFGKLTELPQESVNYKGKDADYIDVSINVDEAE